MSHLDSQRCDQDNRGLGEAEPSLSFRTELTPGRERWGRGDNMSA